MDAEIIYGMSNEEYHKHPALGSSGMKLLLKSPFKYWNQYLNPNFIKSEQSPALKFGSQYDCWVLENEKYFDRYEIKKTFNIPKMPLLRDLKEKFGEEEGKAKFEENKKILASAQFEKESCENYLKESGKIIVSQLDHDRCVAMKECLIKNESSWILEDGIKQASIFWTDKRTGVRCKCRPDNMLNPGENSALQNGFLLDLKSSRDASPEGFGKQIFELGYDISAAHYINGFKAVFGISEHEEVPWFWAISEKTTTDNKDLLEAVYRPITQEQLIHGNYFANRALDIYANAVKTNEWEGYSKKPEPAITPAWIQNRINKILNGEEV
jgi:PDDEXK-like domain of unknown function (DUF3799)